MTTDSIDLVHLDRAGSHVNRLNIEGVVVHTVTLTLNGQHGGVDVRIQGTKTHEADEFQEYEETVVVN